MTSSHSSDAWAPAACTLPTAERPVRVVEFDDLFAAAVQGVERRSPTLLVLTLTAAPGRADMVRDLTRRETACCSFFTFRLAEGDPMRLDVSVPAGHRDVLDALADRVSRIARPAR